MAVAREAGMSKIHVFPYSPRPGTPAAGMQGRAAPDELKDRAARMRDLSDRLGFAYRQRRVGQSEQVLCETRLEDGTMSGLGADYSRFVLPEGLGAPGRMTQVIVSGVVGRHLTARAAA
jgi:threonylcarbamoyladenosine tRNA methylthiotransferase MtaB